jgi:nucleotide-binding universal stress UspA family protein
VFTCIVVGTDGSDSAGAAVQLAVALAKQDGAQLHIVNAFKPTTSGGQLGVVGGGAPGNPQLSQAIGSEASQRLVDSLADELTGLNVTAHSVHDSPAEAVIQVAESVGADLIVVGNKGMERRVFGSVPNSIAHKAPCNLLIAKTT